MLKLKEVRESTKMSQKTFGASLGLSQGTYQKYESGMASFPDDLKLQLAERYGINLHWLITGEGQMHVRKRKADMDDDFVAIGGDVVVDNLPTRMRDNRKEREDALKDSVVVEMTSLRLSAGPGQEWTDASVTGEKLCIPKRVARRYPHNSDFAGAQVIGDSMEPTLHDGEPVVYVREFIQGDGIYVLAVNGELLVKRLQFDRIFNRLHNISDNTKYRPVEIPLEGLDNVRILGKVVIWVHGEI